MLALKRFMRMREVDEWNDALAHTRWRAAMTTDPIEPGEPEIVD